ncbi:hypothetical protein P7K49_006409, partial [Saguinus oedipus]
VLDSLAMEAEVKMAKLNVLQREEDKKEKRERQNAQDAVSSFPTTQPTHQFAAQFFMPVSAE